jgi:hypothetical protein
MILHVEHELTGGPYRITTNQPDTADDVLAWLWDGDAPAGTQLTLVDQQLGYNKFDLTGVHQEESAHLRPEAYDWLNRAEPESYEDYLARLAGGQQGGGVPGGGSAPRVEMDEATQQRVKKATEEILDGVHVFNTTIELEGYVANSVFNAADVGTVANVGEAFAEAAEAVEAVTGPFAAAVFIAWVGFQVVEAFESEKRLEEQQGFVYGLMWDVMGESDHLPTFVDGITYSADEHREAFTTGVQQGRQKGQDPKIRGRLQLHIATLGARTGLGDFNAAGQTLSDLWRQVREHSPGDSDKDTLPWPIPPNRGWF